ncbi:MAG: Nif3-like dinuclear metal center hexameric protein [Pseudonocardiales bacterium]
MPTLGEIVAVLDAFFDPRRAEPWDAVGLVCGDPDMHVGRVLLAVDPVTATVEQCRKIGADLLLTHHPLLLRPVHGVAADTHKGRIVHRLITSGIALHTAHTNADVATPGVSDALAGILGLRDIRPLPEGDTHNGLGRVGELSLPITLGGFAERVAAALPATTGGIRVSGQPGRLVRTVAVCGGAGDDLLGAVGRCGADVFVTADLRHHPAAEHAEAGGPALIDVPHWASEHPWLAETATRLRAALNDTVDTVVSDLVTDPWTMHLPFAKEPSTAQ